MAQRNTFNAKTMDNLLGFEENTQTEPKSGSTSKRKHKSTRLMRFDLLKDLEELNKIDNPKPKGTKRNSSCQVVKPIVPKKRKTEPTGVRKNLFSATQARSNSPVPFARQSVARGVRTKNYKKEEPLAQQLKDEPPAEPFGFKFPTAPARNPSPKKPTPKIVRTSSSSHSGDESYLQMEQNCIGSPLRNVCNMLQNTALTQNPNKRDFENFKLRLMRLERSFDSFVATYKKELKSVCDDFNDLTKSYSTAEANKENARRSPRIASKNGTSSNAEADLRVATLKKNLNKNVEFDVASPELRKINKANEMYSSMFNNYRNAGVLNTPKLIRSNSKINSLSDVVQKQCLLLQDTPKH